MKFTRTRTFKRAYQRLPANDQKKIAKALRVFAKKPFFPYPMQLNVHKLKGIKGIITKGLSEKPGVWEMHATGSLIITFQYGVDEVFFRNCGDHRILKDL